MTHAIAPLPANEAERLAELRELEILDTPFEAEFDDLTRVAAAVCGAPIAVVSLIDAHRQWFKSRIGVDAAETPRELAFCSHTILQPDLMVVPDAALDPRFRGHPLVLAEPGIRFYAGAPLVTAEGNALGTLCVADSVPRNLTAVQTDALRVLGRQVVAHLMLRRQLRRLEVEAAEREKAEAALRESEGRFRAFMDHAPTTAYMKDEAGRYVFVNNTVLKRFADPEGGWLGKTDHDVFPREFADQFREHDQSVLASGVGIEYPETSPAADGGVTHWQSFKFPLTDVAGRRMLAGMSVDVTAGRTAAAALAASDAKFRTVVDRLAEGVYLLDNATDRIVEANAAMLAMLGYTAEEVTRLTPRDLIAGENEAMLAATLVSTRQALATEGRCRLGNRKYFRKDGTIIDVDVVVTDVPGGATGFTGVIVRDVTEQLQYEERLYQYQLDLEEANARLKSLAATDGLTGLRNRAALNEALGEEAGRAARAGRPVSVILMDVDHFKAFNDAFGHPAGDEVLRGVAAVLRRTARSTDVVARYGGEEFALVLPDTDHAGAVVMAERCRRAVAAARWEHRPITVSVGVATQASDSSDPSALVKRADDALYRSKRAGRNRVTHDSTVGLSPAARV